MTLNAPKLVFSKMLNLHNVARNVHKIDILTISKNRIQFPYSYTMGMRKKLSQIFMTKTKITILAEDSN